MKHPVTFSHPALTPLTVEIQPDQVVWSYGLNTANFATYGGEVMQILSMYFDDMTISGTITTYAEMERIFKWFVRYMQIATAGNAGNGSYDTRPVTFSYHHRGWSFDLYPRQAPSFTYGTEVVAPTWTVISAVAEPEPELANAMMTQITAEQWEMEGGGLLALNDSGTVSMDFFSEMRTPGIGYKEENPFSTPSAKKFKRKVAVDGTTELADFFNDIVGAYADGDFSSIRASKPPDSATGKAGEAVKETPGRKTNG